MTNKLTAAKKREIEFWYLVLTLQKSSLELRQAVGLLTDGEQQLKLLNKRLRKVQRVHPALCAEVETKLSGSASII